MTTHIYKIYKIDDMTKPRIAHTLTEARIMADLTAEQTRRLFTHGRVKTAAYAVVQY